MMMNDARLDAGLQEKQPSQKPRRGVGDDQPAEVPSSQGLFLLLAQQLVSHFVARLLHVLREVSYRQRFGELRQHWGDPGYYVGGAVDVLDVVKMADGLHCSGVDLL